MVTDMFKKNKLQYGKDYRVVFPYIADASSTRFERSRFPELVIVEPKPSDYEKC